MSDDDVRQLLGQAARVPQRGVDTAMIRRRSRRRRASVIGSGLSVVLAVATVAAISRAPVSSVDVLATSDAETATEGPEREPAAPAPQDDTTATTEALPAEQVPPAERAEPAPPGAPAPPGEVAPEPSPPTTAPDQEPGPDNETTDYGAPLWGRDYVVVAITENGQPKPLVPDRRPWTTQFWHKKIDDNPSLGDVGWRWGGCNGGAADVEVTPDRLQVGNWRSTLIGCPGEEAEADSWAMEFFVSDPYWRVEDDQLWLWSGDTIVELEEGPDD